MRKRTYAPLFPVALPPLEGQRDTIHEFFMERDAWVSSIAHREEPAARDESTLIKSAADRWRFMLVWQHEPHDQFEGIERCLCAEPF